MDRDRAGGLLGSRSEYPRKRKQWEGRPQPLTASDVPERVRVATT